MFDLLPHTDAGSVLPVELPSDLLASHMHQAQFIEDHMPPKKYSFIDDQISMPSYVGEDQMPPPKKYSLIEDQMPPPPKK